MSRIMDVDGAPVMLDNDVADLVDRLRFRVEELERGVRKAIQWFERPEPGPDGEMYPIWQDAADYLREFALKELADE